MGCGASTADGPVDKPEANDTENNNKSHGLDNGDAISASSPKKKAQSPKKNKSATVKPLVENNKENEKRLAGANTPGKGGVAFDIVLENNAKIDSIISKHPPKRLKRLDPLENAPKLTADLLQEKLKLAEEKRLKELENKKEKGRKASRLRANIQQAKEFEKNTQKEEIEEKLKSAGKNRESKLKELEEKKRIREERARRAREKAERMKRAGNEDLEFEVEKDEAFNDDADSWLDGDNMSCGDRAYSNLTDRVYSGRASPQKPFKPLRSEDELKARMSASTTDSYDNAFQRKQSGISRRMEDFQDANDDFFDS